MSKIMLLGDLHGKLINAHKLVDRFKPDLVLQVGDFGAYRNQEDKDFYGTYHKNIITDFEQYYDDNMQFPKPMYFIGGNHEPYQYLDKFKEYPAQICNNIKYLGRQFVGSLNGLNIVAISGI